MPTQGSPNSLRSQQGLFAFVSTINAVSSHLYHCYEEKFSGRVELTIKLSSIKPWYLYFEQGSLVWGDGGIHPVRRWQRHLFQHCSADEWVAIEEAAPHLRPGDYASLLSLLLHKMHLQTVEAIVTGLLVEILFDLHQQWSQHQYGSTLQLTFDSVQLRGHTTPIAISSRLVWLQAVEEWQQWQQAKLERYSPNSAPVIVNGDLLLQRVLPSTYQTLVTTMDGTQPLRDLAIKSQKSLPTVTRSLVPYLEQGLLKLTNTEDLQPSIHAATASPELLLPSSLVEPKPYSPLIAYIDDYKVDGQTMGRILRQMGYRFIHIQDPMQALPLLLEHKPDLIFLDLVMPIVNGYEACAQIRRVSRFQETPIVILTSNDGIVDRVRARIVGSTGFLAKPIESAKVRAALQKYLPSPLVGSEKPHILHQKLQPPG